MAYDDRSRDSRTNTTQTTIIGDVSLGARGPAATVYPTPVVLGAPSVTHPARVPDASFRNVGVFVQDEWDVTAPSACRGGPARRSVPRADRRHAGLRRRSRSSQGASRPSTRRRCRTSTGDRLSRRAVTGDIGVVFRPADGAQPARALRPQLPPRQPRRTAVLGAGDGRRHRAEHHGEAGDGPQRRRRAEGARRPVQRRRCRTSTTPTTGSSRPRLVASSTPTARCRRPSTSPTSASRASRPAPTCPCVLRPGVLTLFGNVAFTRGTVLSGHQPR